MFMCLLQCMSLPRAGLTTVLFISPWYFFCHTTLRIHSLPVLPSALHSELNWIYMRVTSGRVVCRGRRQHLSSARYAVGRHPDSRQKAVLQSTTQDETKHKLVHLYTLHNQNLSETDSAKYLGLTITSDLQWNQHINNITNKANSILGLLRRNLRIPSQTIKTHAYQSLVRPHLEYASTVWDPHTQKNIHKLDMVQRNHVQDTARGPGPAREPILSGPRDVPKS